MSPPPPVDGRRLLDDDTLTRSAVVANRTMNRERQLVGVNSYSRALGFDPLDRAGSGWLDLCCGSGRALIQAAERIRRDGSADRMALVGVDLVDYFDPIPGTDLPLRLFCAPVLSWQPDRRFDLITCVHGLHYVGDKLGLLTRAASWLTDGGLLVADLDLAGVLLSDDVPTQSNDREVRRVLREAGFDYDPRRHRIMCEGRRDVRLPFEYLGADDRAGPNYTRQHAVDSYYRRT